MNNKKIVTIIITVIFIGAAGILYSLGANKDTNSNMILEDKSEERALNENKTISDEVTQNQEVNKNDDGSAKQDESDNVVNDEKSAEPSFDKNTNGVTITEATELLIYVHICGEVKKPDVYKVKKDTRVIDLIHLAGGLTKDAAGDSINQAKVVTDGERIYIPSKKEAKEHVLSNESLDVENNAARAETSTSSSFVNINTASTDELMTLAGIGEAKANSIIHYREMNGPFKSIEEIKNIEGIKDGVYNKICNQITIN